MPVGKLAVDAKTASPDTPISEIAEIMAAADIGDVIITEGDEPVGIVTDRDIVMKYAGGKALDDLDAEDVMTPNPATIHEDAADIELPRQLAEAGVRRLPVVDDDGMLVGIVTLDDLVATIGEEMKDVATVIEAQSPDYSPE